MKQIFLLILVSSALFGAQPGSAELCLERALSYYDHPDSDLSSKGRTTLLKLLSRMELFDLIHSMLSKADCSQEQMLEAVILSHIDTNQELVQPFIDRLAALNPRKATKLVRNALAEDTWEENLPSPEKIYRTFSAHQLFEDFELRDRDGRLIVTPQLVNALLLCLHMGVFGWDEFGEWIPRVIVEASNDIEELNLVLNTTNELDIFVSMSDIAEELARQGHTDKHYLLELIYQNSYWDWGGCEELIPALILHNHPKSYPTLHSALTTSYPEKETIQGIASILPLLDGDRAEEREALIYWLDAYVELQNFSPGALVKIAKSFVEEYPKAADSFLEKAFKAAPREGNHDRSCNRFCEIAHLHLDLMDQAN